MCETVSSVSIHIPHSIFKSPNSNSQITHILTNPKLIKSQFITACFKYSDAEKPTEKPFGRSSVPRYEELGFQEMGRDRIQLRSGRERRESTRGDEGDLHSSSAGIRGGVDDERDPKSADERPGKDHIELDLNLEEMEQKNARLITKRRRGKQLMKRSNLLAKQVISIQSALGLGFISQLWVDTLSWAVLVIEVRPHLLSGEIERFFLEDVRQDKMINIMNLAEVVGDVVLIQGEDVMENDLQMAGLETLVGYDVITPGRQNIGKVRGYTFNINSGAVESLELDSFGISIIPSSLVSTYTLLVEDVLEVVPDTVVVHEAAALRIQRLTKGFWGSQKPGSSIDELEGYSDDLVRPKVKLEKGQSRRRTSNKKFRPRKRADLDNWELPKDFI